jgi:glucose/arabinose dehydrogenase
MQAVKRTRSKRWWAVVALLGACLGAAGAADSAPRHSVAGFAFRQVTSGLDSPVFVTSAPGDPTTLYVVEQRGVIAIVRGGKVTGTFLDIRPLVKSGGEQGLLSMAFDPGYTADHVFYVSYTDTSGNSRVVRYRAENGVGIRSSAKALLGLQQPYPNHNGGQLQFDNRGYLYVGFGDGGSENDPQQTSQNMSSRLGKLLRSSTTAPNGSWRVVGLGLRNPWRFSFDSRTDNLWIGDVGQDHFEEIDFRPAAKLDVLANFGWSRYEANVVFDGSHRYTNVGQKTFPVLVYSHDHGCSVTGGYVYRGTAVPTAQGRYFYGDYCAGTVWSFPTGAHGRAGGARITGHIPSLSGFGVNGRGELYAVSLAGTLYKLAR